MNIFDRTFHPDEANQAFTTGHLLETGTYRYNPQDHHGPTLYYAAATLQKVAGHDSTATLDPALLRCTPLLFAVLALVLGCLAVRKLTGRLWLGLLFAFLLGTSPIFMFFATDFIQEMLLASFTMMMLWTGTNYLLYIKPSTPQATNHANTINANARTLKRPTWALLFGIATGLAFATKETAVLTFAAIGISAFVLRITQRRTPSSNGHLLPAALAFAGFLLTATLLYSSFGDNWRGVFNAFIAAPLAYLHRAVGDAASQGATAHIHPWWQYFKWLFAPALCPFSEWLLLVPIAVASCCNAFKSRRLLFAATYTGALTALYSAIPYKTPWCALQIAVALAITASLSIGHLLAHAQRHVGPVRRLCERATVIFFVLLIFLWHGCGMTIINRQPDSKKIPYNYASASPQARDLASLIIEKLSSPPPQPPATRLPAQASDLFAAIALPPEDTWPLPFYLRSANDKIGYWASLGELEALAGLGRKPTVVVVSAEEGHLVQPLFPHLKNTKRFEMRPHVRVRAFW